MPGDVWVAPEHLAPRPHLRPAAGDAGAVVRDAHSRGETLLVEALSDQVQANEAQPDHICALLLLCPHIDEWTEGVVDPFILLVEMDGVGAKCDEHPIAMV